VECEDTGLCTPVGTISAPRFRAAATAVGGFHDVNRPSLNRMKGAHMNKNIILLSDGTGNGAAKRNKTNVWRLYDALDLHRDDQVAFYDDGVGSQEFLPFKLLGGALGWGLKRNVRELYKFLCRNYRSGDRIYLFGFSRGAFTVRMLAGMIAYCGIYTEDKSEKALEKAARHNYNVYRSRFNAGFLTRGVRVFMGRTDPVSPRHLPDIEFIGAWDTVDAYGFPIDEIAQLWNFLVYPIYFPNHTLSEKVKKACHALSVDDERHTFHPVLWDESGETDPARIEQVWFPGVHSDVGGGYPMQTLSLVALDWMIEKAAAASNELGSPGLHFLPWRRDEFEKHADWHGPQHDSRAMAGAYYRYKPRDVASLCSGAKSGVRIYRPKIHRSVMERIAGGVVPYAPTGLPGDYEVVATRGTAPVYETPEGMQQRKKAMAAALKVVTLRRWLYFGLLFTTLGYLVSPLLFGCLDPSGCTSAEGPLERVLAMVMHRLPDIAAPWIQVLRHSPAILYALVLLFTALSFLKARAWTRTRQLANDAWAGVKR
jgi:hypothetical protein